MDNIMTELELTQLRAQCHTVLPGHRTVSPSAEFSAMAAYCEQHQIVHDTYGEGGFIQQFEQKIADLLGFEAGVFCITGTMTQTLALRLACAERGSSLVALHPTAHILKHENSNYQVLDHFNVQQIGDPFRVWNAADLSAVKDNLGAALVELPMREIGGQLISLDELSHIKNYCHAKNIHLHMDGARLWEAQAGYGHPFTEITQGFDSVYVSFYKGIGGMAGAMLLGNTEFVAKAKVWMHRQGGSVFRRSPYVVSAAMQFEQRLAAMPACYAKTKEIVQLIQQFSTLKINPGSAHCNMFHLYLPVSRERAIEIRNQIAQESGIWLFNRASHAALPNQSYLEWMVGDQALALSNEAIETALALLDQAITRCAKQ
jgi:threonine aldolase